MKVGPLYKINLESQAFVNVNQGGTSSGKTIAILQVLFTLAASERCTCTVVGQDVPNLKRGAFRDSLNIYYDNDSLRSFFNVLKGDRVYTGRNGSIIEFVSYEDSQDAKSGKRDYTFLNECDGISYSIFLELYLRTTKKMFLDYNPTVKFWVHDKLIGEPNVIRYISNHLHNPFLSQEIHDKIEAIKDPDLFKVYARGKTGKLQGMIYQYEVIDEMPDNLKRCYMGLDFGYVNDPSALIKVGMRPGELFIDEIYYREGMLIADHLSEMRKIGVKRGDIIVADSSRQDTIDELRANGMPVIPSMKGPNSIIPGIDMVKNYKLFVTKNSKNIINELDNYTWASDKNNNPLNMPVDKFNHALDAIRYVVYTLLSDKKSKSRGQVTASIGRIKK